MAPTCQCGCGHGAGGPARPDETVEQVVQRSPAARAALDELGINHCCGAHLTLAEAAAAAGVGVERLLARLAEAAAGAASPAP